uniref:Uncharacterized protein n=1 Tax=Anguilla anguilla TaxID=7936 RepID=A0A0E9T199_ANGAN
MKRHDNMFVSIPHTLRFLTVCEYVCVCAHAYACLCVCLCVICSCLCVWV